MGKKKQSTEQKAKRLLEIALDKKPDNPRMIDVRGMSPVWDYLIFLTVGSSRQGEAIASHLRKEAKGEKLGFHHVEHGGEGAWILLDFSDVAVHIFSSEKREFYDIEKFYQDAKDVE